jgi:hypothetical protein
MIPKLNLYGHDFTTKIDFFTVKVPFRFKKTFSDTISPCSVTFIKPLMIFLFHFLEKYTLWRTIIHQNLILFMPLA